jgi:hypothetical protein
MERLTIKRRYGGAFKQWRILLQCYKTAKERNAVEGFYGTPSPEDIVSAGSLAQSSIKRFVNVDKWKEDSDGWEKWLYDRVHSGVRVIPFGTGPGEDGELVSSKNVITDIRRWMNTDSVPRTIGVVQSCLVPRQIDSLDAFARVRYELMKSLNENFEGFTSVTARIVDRLYFYALPLDQYCGYHDVVDNSEGDLARFDGVVARTKKRLLEEGADEDRLTRYEYGAQEMRLSLMRNPARNYRSVVIPRAGRLSEASNGYLSRMRFLNSSKLNIGSGYARRIGHCPATTVAFQECLCRLLADNEKKLVAVLDSTKTVESPYLQRIIEKFFRVGVLERSVKVPHLLGCDVFDTGFLGLVRLDVRHLQYVEYIPDLHWNFDLIPRIDGESIYEMVTAKKFVKVYSEVVSVKNFIEEVGYFSMDSKEVLPTVAELNCLD